MLILLCSLPAHAESPPVWDTGPHCYESWWRAYPLPTTVLDAPVQPTILLPMRFTNGSAPTAEQLPEVRVTDAQGVEVAGTVLGGGDDPLIGVPRWTPTGPLTAGMYTLTATTDAPAGPSFEACDFVALDEVVTFEVSAGPAPAAEIAIHGTRTVDDPECGPKSRRLKAVLRIDALGAGGSDYHYAVVTYVAVPDRGDSSHVIEDVDVGAHELEIVWPVGANAPATEQCVHAELVSVLEGRVVASFEDCSEVSDHVVPATACGSNDIDPDLDEPPQTPARAPSDDGCASGSPTLVFLWLALPIALLMRSRHLRRHS